MSELTGRCPDNRDILTDILGHVNIICCSSKASERLVPSGQRSNLAPTSIKSTRALICTGNIYNYIYVLHWY